MVLIPRVVHRIWFGPHRMRDELVQFGRTWEAHGYTVRLWTETDLPADCEMRPLMDRIARNGVNTGNGVPELGVWVQWADIVSYWLVWKYGGIYANTDMECLQNLDPLLEDVDCFAGIEVGEFIGNALFGATPGHPFFRELLDDLPARYEARTAVGQAMNEVTGPHCLTDAHKRNPGLLTVFPQERFYPYSHVEMSREWDAHPGAYTSHHWGHTRNRHAS